MRVMLRNFNLCITLTTIVVTILVIDRIFARMGKFVVISLFELLHHIRKLYSISDSIKSCSRNKGLL